jgi:thioredoxin 1
MKILKFQAVWCNSCHFLSETLSKMELGMIVEPVDIDRDVAICSEYGVRSIPTMILIDDKGIEQARMNGNQTPAKITEFIKKGAASVK